MKKTLALTAITILIMSSQAYSDVIINEISRDGVVWVELHNTGSGEVDLSGWKIRNSNGEDPILGRIKPGGYLVICESSQELRSHYKDIPSPIFEIRDGELGSGLKANSDMVALVAPDGSIVDQVNWGIPSSGWHFYNSALWNPGILDHSPILARIPNSFDRDMPEDFKGLASGTPGSMNQVYNGLGTVSWGKIKAIFAGQKRR